jgi:putative salt-induced outer membrane protein YdiY
MRKLLLTIITVLVTQIAMADEMSLSIGGMTDSTNSMINSIGSYAHKDKSASPFSEYVDFDSLYKTSGSKTTTNFYDLYGKVNYELGDGRNYLQTAGRYQFNEFGHYNELVVVGVGHGYRIIKNDTMKLSAETSIAEAEAKGLSQLVGRESIWFTYRFLPKASLSEKFLIEEGGPLHYTKNMVAVEYELSEHLVTSVGNTWIRDRINNSLTNITTFNLGIKF